MCVIPEHIPKTGKTVAVYFFDETLNATTVKSRCCELCQQYNAHWQAAISPSLNCEAFYYRAGDPQTCRPKCGLKDSKAASTALEHKDPRFGYASESAERTFIDTDDKGTGKHAHARMLQGRSQEGGWETLS